MNDLMGNAAFHLFGICFLVLALKMMTVGAYTSYLRITRKVYATGEDYGMQGMNPSDEVDGEIERVRRAHRNDLENILPFFGVGLLYAFSEPSMIGAQINFFGYTIARVLHSFFYIGGLQPHRTIAFTVGAVLMLYMTVTSLLSFL